MFIASIICLLLSFLAAHPFGLEFLEEEGDRSYGHHGLPADYNKVMEGGIIHPWDEGRRRRLSGGRRGNSVTMDPMTELFDLTDFMDTKKKSKDEDELAVLTIMESTPEMCPLCAKEGHTLGHEEHKRFLTKLREKMLGKAHSTCALCAKEGTVQNHEMHSCALCKAEGSTEHHGLHKKLMDLATELGFENGEHKHDFGCKLCNKEGTGKNHKKHIELMASLKNRIEREQMNSGDVLREEEGYRKILKKITDLLDEHRDMQIAAIAEARLTKDRHQRVPSMMTEFIFGEDDFSYDDDEEGLFDFDGFEMMKSVKADPPRNFHRRPGEPADRIAFDDFEDDEDGEKKESLWEYILRNLKDMFGLESTTMEDDDEASSDFGLIIAMILLLFTGLLLVSFGIVELFAAFLGDDSANGGKYQPLDYDAEERMILDGEHGQIAI